MTKELKNFVAGEWRASDQTFEKRSPFDGSLVASVHEASEAMVNDAVLAGREVSIGAKSGSWGALPKPALIPQKSRCATARISSRSTEFGRATASTSMFALRSLSKQGIPSP